LTTAIKLYKIAIAAVERCLCVYMYIKEAAKVKNEHEAAVERDGERRHTADCPRCRQGACSGSPDGVHALDDGKCLCCSLDVEYTPLHNAEPLA